ncbi:MAG: LuxR C-terminal-related transcriptional regulator [Symbiobacteriaceae bacterium]|nr:LuxR C-terminal-related transcriptional regulator [Symbiobacteriaceae bacterium]
MKSSNATGVYPQGVLAGMTPRTELVQRLKLVSARRSIYLFAPSGYGKTVVAAQWLASLRGRGYVIMARDAISDPGAFYSHLLAALQTLIAGEVSTRENLSSFPELLEAVRALPERHARRYLVIDDLHLISDEEIAANLALLARELPSYICLCLISRSAPGILLLATGRFTIFSRDDLLFSAYETAWLATEKERDLSNEQIADLLHTTGGWAIYLFALLSGDMALSEINSGQIPATLTQYLEERVWRLWDDTLKGRMLKLALPTVVTPALCQRLTGLADGRAFLYHLTQQDNLFMSATTGEAFSFHEILREFLLQRLTSFFSSEEIHEIYNTLASWYFALEDYNAATRFYILNDDQEGITHCTLALLKVLGNDVESRMIFSRQYVMNLPAEFIAKNPSLIAKCASLAYYDGEPGLFKHYADMLYQADEEYTKRYPEFLELRAFTCWWDFRKPLREANREIVELVRRMRAMAVRQHEETTPRTMDLPLFHRSMIDLSCYYQLNDEDILSFIEAYNALIGRDSYAITENIHAGIQYERGDLLEATRHALNAYHACDASAHPTTMFCSGAILAESLFAMSALQQADQVLAELGNYIEASKRFPRLNYVALQTRRSLQKGDPEPARRWLSTFASRTSRLPLYHIYQHFTTLRCQLALGEYAAAILLGERLIAMADNYRRVFDRIESGVLTSIAYDHMGEQKKALVCLRGALQIAAPYGFVQLFCNEATDILPLLLRIRGEAVEEGELQSFLQMIISRIYDQEYSSRSNGTTSPQLTPQQLAVLHLLQQGFSYDAIAQIRGVSRNTAKTHILALYRRLGVNDTAQALRKASLLGLLR